MQASFLKKLRRELTIEPMASEYISTRIFDVWLFIIFIIIKINITANKESSRVGLVINYHF